MPNKKVILGIDEVGRGPWAGPLVVGAVILGEEFIKTNEIYAQLADSKILSKRKREELSPIILNQAAASATGWVSAAELDRYGLSASLKLATRRAVKQILAKKSYFSEVIIDGTGNFLENTPLENRVTLLKKADSLVKEVSAASIIAKVARDNYMTELSKKYPRYSFEKHAGYGTAAHKAALEKFGLCPEHRQSFRPIKEIMTKSPENRPKKCLESDFGHSISTAPSSSQKGQTAELVVANYLKTQNHQIIAHNFKTKSYEIDLISIRADAIFFTEVKYSQKTHTEGSPLVRITPKKQSQMQFAAQAFLSTHSEYRNLQPFLAVASVSGTNFQVCNWFVI